MLFSVFAMSGRVFLVFAALSWCSAGVEGEASVKIKTYAGETVTLPCQILMSDDQDVPSIEWSKEGLNSFVHVYRGCEMFHDKDPVFRYRTHLFMSELKNGNISLRLSNVSLSDAGKYKCKIIQKPPREVATVELFVGAVSEPKLSVVPAIGGQVSLQCEADCWSPSPQITFLDAQRNIISAEETKTDRVSSRGCFTATKRLTVQSAQWVTCRVEQPEINQTRFTEIYIPDECLRSCTQDIIIATVVAAALCGSLGALITFLCNKYSSCVRKDKVLSLQSSLQSSTRSNAECHNWRNQTEQDNQNTINELRRANDELMSNLHDKEQTIRQLTEERNDLRSKEGAVVLQHHQPTIASSPPKPSPAVSRSIQLTIDPSPQDNEPKPTSTNNNHPKSSSLPQNKNSGVSKDNPEPGARIQKSRHNKSCPALLTDITAESCGAPSSSPVGRKTVSRSRSLSMSHSLSPSRLNAVRSKHRHTASVASFNRFAVLENLPEDDSEPLL